MGRGHASLAIAVLLSVWLTGCGGVLPAPPLSSCTAQTAERVSARDLARFYGLQVHRCVRVEGVLWQRFLYDRIESIYREQAGDNPAVIAVYGGTTAMDDGFARQRTHVDIVGLATSCSQIYADATRDNPGRDVMIIGPCHTFLGAAIAVADYKTLDAEPPRLMGPSAFAGYGDLTPEPAQAVGVQAKAAAESWFAAARAHDLAKMRDLMRWSASVEQLLVPLEIPASAADGSIAYFRHRSRDRHDHVQLDVACVCRAQSCDGRWPIALVDTSPGPAWPYDCATIFDDFHVDMQW